MSRLKLKRFKAEKPPQAVLDHYLREYKSRILHFDPSTLPPLTGQELFGNDHPLVFDLGCGRGEFINGEAAAHPENNYVGFDYHWKSLWRSVGDAHAAGLDNVRFLRCDFRRIMRKVPDASVTAVYLLFPPPAPLYNKPKEDTLTATTLAAYHRVLVAGGTFHFVTDNGDYFADKLELIRDTGLFEIMSTAQQFEGGMTWFQEFWESRDIESKRMACRKRSATE